MTQPKPSPESEFEGCTPGEWLHNDVSGRIEVMNGRSICLVYFEDGDIESYSANARLIAAAPTLLSENERLKGEVARVSDLARRLAKLFHAAAQASWDGCDLDGGTIQSLGEELRLLKREPYDPEEHGESIDADPGDEIFTLTDDVRAAINPPGGQG